MMVPGATTLELVNTGIDFLIIHMLLVPVQSKNPQVKFKLYTTNPNYFSFNIKNM